MSSLKQALKQVLINRQHKQYQKEVVARNLTYDRWIRQLEEGLEAAPALPVQKSQEFFQVSAEELGRNCEEMLERNTAEILLVSFYEGEISRIALPLIQKKFEEDKSLIMIYGDEDILQNEERKDPWFKPDWSPDTFLSYFYFGGLVAVRAENMKQAYVSWKNKTGKDIPAGSDVRSRKEIIYHLLFEALCAHQGFERGHDVKNQPVAHIKQVLFHSYVNGYEQIKELSLGKEAHIHEDIQSAAFGERDAGTEKVNAKQIKMKAEPLISIIIPSKDNPEVLFQCINSFLERTKTKYSYEILVIDNGSSEENKKTIEQRIVDLNKQTISSQSVSKDTDKTGNVGSIEAQKPQGLIKGSYLYQPMPFNFSRMCNMGAEAAKGEVLLFLNDDMEIIQQDWLDLLMEKVQLPYVGVVGAKLLYPESEIIQHAGITNLRVGPAHKLQYLSDENVYYFGKNRGVHNMLAVTGACLMVRKEVFLQAGGFAEVLAVAFNDVDLCYTIHEQGYYNVQRNDVVLYHHESLSRGKDGESTEKQLRLQKEKDILYERHQDIYGKDPFYHENLTMDMLESEYSPAFHYQVKLDMPWSQAFLCTEQVAKAREDQCLVVGMECAMDLYKWQYGVSPEKGKVKPRPEDMGYYFQGYSFVIGADNACYKKTLLLRNQDTGQVYGIPMESRYRQDIKRNLKDQLNVDLTGYAAKLQKEKLPEGIYRFGMLAEDTCSRQKLVNWSNWVLEERKGNRYE